MRNQLTIILALLLVLTINSCSISELSGDRNLGGGYYLWTEGKDGQSNAILLSTTQPYKGAGLIIIAPTVIKVKFDEKVILALSKNPKSLEEEYWMIDKEKTIDLSTCLDKTSCDSVLKQNVLGPLSYEGFIDLASQKGIKLRFEK
ncbi:MAG: hypothetical protein AAGH46_12870 [Bacteroidota bacterium]